MTDVLSQQAVSRACTLRHSLTLGERACTARRAAALSCSIRLQKPSPIFASPFWHRLGWVLTTGSRSDHGTAPTRASVHREVCSEPCDLWAVTFKVSQRVLTDTCIAFPDSSDEGASCCRACLRRPDGSAAHSAGPNPVVGSWVPSTSWGLVRLYNPSLESFTLKAAPLARSLFMHLQLLFFI